MSDIVRAWAAPVEAMTIQRGEGTSRRIRGLASVYYDGSPGTEYGLGVNMVERIAPGAWDHLLGDDCIACVDHDAGKIVGRNGSNLRLWTSPRGLEYEIDLPDTTIARDLFTNVQAGIIRGSSFKAAVKYGSASDATWSKSGQTDIVTIKRFDRLRDISCVVSAAYKAADCATVARARDDMRAMEETLSRMAIVANLKY